MQLACSFLCLLDSDLLGREVIGSSVSMCDQQHQRKPNTFCFCKLLSYHDDKVDNSIFAVTNAFVASKSSLSLL